MSDWGLSETKNAGRKRVFGELLSLFCLALLAASLFSSPAHAWSNGGFSADPSNPKYGTHDWLAHHALDFVPDEMDFWIRDNLALYLYGTELPDNRNAPLNDGIGDTHFHHVYYRSNGQLQDDSAARRAQEAYNQTLSYLIVGDYGNAAKWMGVVTHYVSDLAVFGHVMGKATDWGEEKHHSDYERWVNERTSRYESSFTTFLTFDGKLDAIHPYEAALKLAYDTTFDNSGKGRTAKWMDDNYDPESLLFQERVRESLNLAVNLLADVIHATSEAAGIPELQVPAFTLALALVTVILIVRSGLTRKNVKKRSPL